MRVNCGRAGGSGVSLGGCPSSADNRVVDNVQILEPLGPSGQAVVWKGAWQTAGSVQRSVLLHTSSSRGKMSGRLLQGHAFILKNVGKETRRSPSSSLFGRVRRDRRSFWPTWLWLCLRSLCRSVKQPSVQINREGRSILLSYRTGRKVRL